MEKSAPNAPAALLREARTRANLSQNDVARRAHVAQSVVSAYESGRREPAFATLERLIAATGHRLDVRVEPAGSARPGLPDTPYGRRLRQRRRQVLAVATKHGASNVRVFGSVARGEDTPDSDIDILVDLSPKSSLVRWDGWSESSATFSALRSMSFRPKACERQCVLKRSRKRSLCEPLRP